MARRILLADDSVTAQNMGRRILTDAGYEVVTVNNGSAALKKIAENKPDIIVLDVYMPGYGGLEVCQRVKENPDTARIPVLLTVGKLEPFKPEESRRVGADAFIVKPFEATELLTALTKLEDKIVAGPQPQKIGRFAKVLSAIERSDSGERFGDKETGWKNRLTIPSPNSKAKAAETEAPEIAAGPARDFEHVESAAPAEPKPEFERPIPAGLPADITPEEIAAITAAAASFDGKAGHPTVIPEGSASESAAAMQAASEETEPVPSDLPETSAATLASATESEAAAPAETVVEPTPIEPETVPTTAASSETAKVEEPAAPELSAPAPEPDPAQATPEVQDRETDKTAGNDAEVMAAIASLAPSNGHGNESAVAVPDSNGAGQAAAVMASSAITVEAGITGPRWIAELVAVTLEESAPTLEQEMEQASAAKLAAENASNDLAAAAEAPAPVAVVEAIATVVAEVSSAVEPVAETVPPATAAEANVAEFSEVTAESQPAAAFAAAASAGSTSDSLPAVATMSATAVSPEISESAPATSSEVAPQREAELAAAWQSWKQIRESFGSAPSAAPAEEAPAAEAQIAEPAAAEAPAAEVTTQEESAAPAKVEEADAEAAEVEAAAGDLPVESTAIASIVDTMLAELRPKLVEEIAKKMSSEKKEKEKEKEKEKKKRK